VSAKGAAATKKSAAVNVVATPKPKKVTAAQPALTVVKSDVPATKHCKKCSTTKPVEEFAKDKSSKDGRYSQCLDGDGNDICRQPNCGRKECGGRDDPGPDAGPGR